MEKGDGAVVIGRKLGALEALRLGARGSVEKMWIVGEEKDIGCSHSGRRGENVRAKVSDEGLGADAKILLLLDAFHAPVDSNKGGELSGELGGRGNPMGGVGERDVGGRIFDEWESCG